MNIRKSIAGIASVAVLTLVLAGAAFAQETAIGIAGGDNITYTPGQGNGFTLVTNSGLYKDYLTNVTNSPVTTTFTGMTNTYIGAVPVYTPPDPVTGVFTQELNPGTFTITSGSTTLLSGTFGYSNLSGVDQSVGGSPGTSASGTVNLVANDLTYTGGTDFDSSKFQSTGGVLSIEYTATGPIVASATQVNSFIATDGVTFEAVPLPVTGVPEPASVAGLGIGLLFLVGLGLRAKKRNAFKIA
jgi:hypothetical protein